MRIIFRFDIIADYIREHGYLKDTFCDACGIEIKELTKMQMGDLDFKFESLCKISNFINIDLLDFFVPYPVPAKY